MNASRVSLFVLFHSLSVASFSLSLSFSFSLSLSLSLSLFLHRLVPFEDTRYRPPFALAPSPVPHSPHPPQPPLPSRPAGVMSLLRPLLIDTVPTIQQVRSTIASPLAAAYPALVPPPRKCSPLVRGRRVSCLEIICWIQGRFFVYEEVNKYLSNVRHVQKSMWTFTLKS